MTPEHLHLLFPISLLSAACHVSQVPGDSAVPGFDSSSKSQHQIITAGFYIKKPTMRQSVHSILWKTKKRSGIMISFLSWVQFKKKESKKEKNVPLVAYKSWYIWQTGCNCTTQSRLTCTTKRKRRLYDCLSFVLALHVKISEGKWVKKKITANKRSPPMRTVRKCTSILFTGSPLHRNLSKCLPRRPSGHLLHGLSQRTCSWLGFCEFFKTANKSGESTKALQ